MRMQQFFAVARQGRIWHRKKIRIIRGGPIPIQRKKLVSWRKPALALTVLILGMGLASVAPPPAAHASTTVNLVAHFRLYGEVQRFGYGYGDMDIHFGVVNSAYDYPVPSIGQLGFAADGVFSANGVLASLNGAIKGDGAYYVVDTTFDYPFSIPIDDNEQQTAASLYIGLGDNGIGGPQGGSKQVVFDFADDYTLQGVSVIGATPDQGLTLTSVTAPDGYQFAFNRSNTQLAAGASAWDTAGAPYTSQTVTAPDPGTTDPLKTRAAVFFPMAAATSKLEGGLDQYAPAPDGSFRTTGALVDLDVFPEPNPPVFDLAAAVVTGRDNVTLTKTTPTDTTAPVLSLPGDLNAEATSANGAAVTYQVSATDNVDGAVPVDCDHASGDTFPPGDTTVTCTATDNAGNKATGTFTVTVHFQWKGFTQPVNDPAAQAGQPVSVFKAGSTVPVKFQLTAPDGTVLQAPADPGWLTPARGSAMTLSVGEAVYADAATTGTSFRWDPDAQQYIYNWKTTPDMAGYYWQIGVRLPVGTTHYVTVGLR